MKSNKIYIVAALLLILAGTNPSKEDFNSLVAKKHKRKMLKEYDYLLFSIYQDAHYHYLGIAGDFFRL